MESKEIKIKPKLLIVTGPQGSGNHLFAKLFSLHPAVEGWPMLRTEWKGHHEEPFAPAWDNPTLLKDKPWSKDKYYMTSISCPYIKGNKPHTPKYNEFITEAKKHCDVQIVIIVRDCPFEIYKDYLKNDSNKPYIRPAEGKFDNEVKKACEES